MYSGFDSTSDSSFVAAAKWLQAAMFGTIATSIAIVAVAALGVLLLQGQLPVRRSATVILGCFLLFGSSLLAAGLQSGAAAFASGAPPPMVPRAAVSAPVYPAPQGLPGNDRYTSPTALN